MRHCRTLCGLYPARAQGHAFGVHPRPYGAAHPAYLPRTERVLKRYGEIKNVGIEKRLAKKDKQRKTYYKYYTDQQWGNYHNYDVALDSGELGKETCVHIICELYNKK